MLSIQVLAVFRDSASLLLDESFLAIPCVPISLLLQPLLGMPLTLRFPSLADVLLLLLVQPLLGLPRVLCLLSLPDVLLLLLVQSLPGVLLRANLCTLLGLPRALCLLSLPDVLLLLLVQSLLGVLLRANLCTLLVPVLLRLLLLLPRFALVVLSLLDLPFVFLTVALLVLSSSILLPALLCERRESERDEYGDADRGGAVRHRDNPSVSSAHEILL